MGWNEKMWKSTQPEKKREENHKRIDPDSFSARPPSSPTCTVTVLNQAHQ